VLGIPIDKSGSAQKKAELGACPPVSGKKIPLFKKRDRGAEQTVCRICFVITKPAKKEAFFECGLIGFVHFHLKSVLFDTHYIPKKVFCQ
jgi:hypothetical protein